MTCLAIFQQLGVPEVVIILLVVMLLFGSKKIPELARSLGRSLGEFKKGRAEGDAQLTGGASDKDAKAEKSDPDAKA